MQSKEEPPLAYVGMQTGHPCIFFADAITSRIMGRMWMDRIWIARANLGSAVYPKTLEEQW